jgi:hypothetical protein
MKKYIIIGTGIILLVVILVLVKDAELRRGVVGTWTGGVFTMTISSDGSYSARFGTETNPDTLLYGTWVVRGGALVMTCTNASGTKPHELSGSVDRLKIIQMDESHLVTQTDNGVTNAVERKR